MHLIKKYSHEQFDADMTVDGEFDCVKVIATEFEKYPGKILFTCVPEDEKGYSYSTPKFKRETIKAEGYIKYINGNDTIALLPSGNWYKVKIEDDRMIPVYYPEELRQLWDH